MLVFGAENHTAIVKNLLFTMYDKCNTYLEYYLERLVYYYEKGKCVTG
ncbi:MAG: hypothetical protein PUF12_09085 [Thermoflexaceae bacterium]|nr:hypothetical protein [Thermoflexaceae bacterium]